MNYLTSLKTHPWPTRGTLLKLLLNFIFFLSAKAREAAGNERASCCRSKWTQPGATQTGAWWIPPSPRRQTSNKAQPFKGQHALLDQTGSLNKAQIRVQGKVRLCARCQTVKYIRMYCYTAEDAISVNTHTYFYLCGEFYGYNTLIDESPNLNPSLTPTVKPSLNPNSPFKL